MNEPGGGTAIAGRGRDGGLGAVGDLTIHGVTRSVVFPLEAWLGGDTIVVVGYAAVTFSDFGIQVPSAPIVVSAEDGGILELHLFFRRP